jgi:outer membrane protein assembly factor BamD
MSLLFPYSNVLRANVLRACALIVAALPLGACETVSSFNPFAEKQSKSDIGADEPAERLFNDGIARMSNKSYEDAAKKFAELDKQYPYSSWSRRGLLLTTSAQYEAGNYAESINSGKQFVQRYPATADAAYAQYIVGMSYFNQIPDVTRDQERSEKALQAFEELVRRWPNSEYAPDSKLRIQISRDQLAGKEMTVGRHYLKQRNYTGAVNRFREVLIKYQTTRHSEEALARLTEAYMALGIVGEAQTAAAVLGHNYPDSQWYKDSFALLQTGGLEPREDAGSWISRAFRGAGRMVGL